MSSLKEKIQHAGLAGNMDPMVGSSNGICGQCIVCTPGHIIDR